ncbi:hypothetical protein Tco_1348865 [Tanacetum coccineum]
MAEPIINKSMEKAHSESYLSITSNNIKINLSKEFLEELQKNTYHGWIDEDVIDRIAKMNGNWNKRQIDNSILSSNNTTSNSFFIPNLKTHEKSNTRKEEEQSQTKRKYSNTSSTTDEQPNKRRYQDRNAPVFPMFKAGPHEGNINEYWWRIYEYGNLEVLES